MSTTPKNVLILSAMARFFSVLLVLCFVASCGDDDGPGADASIDSAADSATLDAAFDTGFEDADTDASEVDAGEEDAGETDGGEDASAGEGYGAIMGPCEALGERLDLEGPSFFVTRFTFPEAFSDPDDRGELTAEAQEVLMDGTAGGSSGLSEAFAMEVLARCEGAALIKSETEITYDNPDSKKIDILVDVEGVRVGVSVTRAVSFPPDSPYTEERAQFIEDKLEDLQAASEGVSSEDSFAERAIVIFAYGDMHAESIESVWEAASADIRGDISVYVVITDGEDDSIYFE